MDQKRFQRTKEDFECSRCGTVVSGDGYTNHCPDCLWSKHVDINPGDREEKCQGDMEPVAVESEGDTHRIVHRCTTCGYEHKSPVTKRDAFAKVIEIAQKRAEQSALGSQ